MFRRVEEYIDAIFSMVQIKAIVAFLGAGFLAVVGANWLAYEILFILVVVDFITGFSCGIKCKTVSSRRASRTITKLIVYILLVLAAHQLTRYAFFLEWLEHFLVIFLASTEMISILENAHKLGVPVPHWVIEKLETYLDKPTQ